MRRVIGLSQQANFSLSDSIRDYLTMNYQLKLEQIDKLKARLDGFRPLEPMIVAELKKLYDVRFTKNDGFKALPFRA